MVETEKYKSKLVSFLNEIQGSVLERLVFEVDTAPTFDKTALQFDFEYCFSVTFITDEGMYKLYTAITSSGLDTFWMEHIESLESNELIKPINSKVKVVDYKNGISDLPYKINIVLEDRELIMYAAEIYDTADGNYKCSINDEMILLFEDKQEAEKFEAAL